MGKLTIYILIMSGLTLLFYFAGLLTGTANSTLLDFLLNIESIATSPVKIIITAAFFAVATGAAVSLFFNVFNLQAVAKYTLMGYILSIGWDFLAVASKVMSVNRYIGLLLFAPLLMLWIFTVYDYYNPAGL